MSSGPCMCGDLFCGSCGPAQGNTRCDECGRWAADGGCEDEAKCAAASAVHNEAEWQQMQDIERAAREYFTEHPYPDD